VVGLLGRVSHSGVMSEFASADLVDSITDRKGAGQRFGARVVVLSRVRLAVQSLVFPNTFGSPGRRTSVLPTPDGGRPTFDRAERVGIEQNATERHWDAGMLGPRHEGWRGRFYGHCASADAVTTHRPRQRDPLRRPVHD
jgi:hypothetical protein